MALLSLQNITLAFGGPPLLDAVTLDIQKGQRICLLGRNGVGKSTFLKVAAGIISPDDGQIISSPGLRVAYLPQTVPELKSGTVLEAVVRGGGPLGRKLLEWMHGDHVAETQKLQSLHDYLDTHRGWELETAARKLSMQLGLDPMQPVEALSGGMKRRVYLARALVVDPDLLLLDEPTNHMDIESISWMESFLLGSKLTFLFVTHDRKLLRRLANRILELDRGTVVDWSCDYETFLSRKSAVLEAEENQWKEFDKALAQEEQWIRQGIKARRTRNEGRVRALLKMRQERKQRRERAGDVQMKISQGVRSGEKVLDVKGASFCYDDTKVIDDFSAVIQRKSRIGVIGPNGCGKTTLLKLLIGELSPTDGEIERGANLETVYFDQLRQTLEPAKTVWENVAPSGGDTVYVDGKPKHVISYLRDFLFTTDRAKSPVEQLSGGERQRLLLARIFTKPSNLLVLDEPTNDLDTETLELLEEVLFSYQGTILMVSHDREFLNNVVTSLYVFEECGRIREFIGGYDDLEDAHKKERAASDEMKKRKTSEESVTKHRSSTDAPKKLSFKETRELQLLPEKIERLEHEHHDLNLQMADPTYYSKPGFVSSAKERIDRIDTELVELYQRWEELESRPH